MDKNTVIESLNMVASAFVDTDPISVELRGMSAAVASMTEDRFISRLAFSKEKKFCSTKNCGAELKGHYCPECKKMVSPLKEDPKKKEASEVAVVETSVEVAPVAPASVLPKEIKLTPAPDSAAPVAAPAEVPAPAPVAEVPAPAPVAEVPVTAAVCAPKAPEEVPAVSEEQEKLNKEASAVLVALSKSWTKQASMKVAEALVNEYAQDKEQEQKPVVEKKAEEAKKPEEVKEPEEAKKPEEVPAVIAKAAAEEPKKEDDDDDSGIKFTDDEGEKEAATMTAAEQQKLAEILSKSF